MGMLKRQNSGKNMGNVRQENRSLVLRQLYFQGPQSRAVLAKDLSLTPASITMTVNAMIAEGVVADTAEFEVHDGMGRKRQFVDLVLPSRLVVGVSMVTRTIRLAITDLGLHLLYSAAWDLGDYPVATYAKTIGDRIAFGLYALGKTKEAVAGVGVSIRGHVDSEHGVSVDSFGLLPPLTPIQSDLEQITGLPVVVDNHIRSLLVCDALHAHRWVDNSLFIKFGPGISSAIVMHGQLYTGSAYRSGEIGHVVMVPDGPLCRCGKQGCLETYASFRVLREVLGLEPSQSPRDVLQRFEDGDAQVAAVLGHAVDTVLLAIANMAVLFDPAVIVMYGDWFASNVFQRLFLDRVELRQPRLEGKIQISVHNLELDEYMACALAVHQFLQSGAIGGVLVS